jgi:hypothetical protein
MMASREGRADIVQMLIDCGADVEAVDKVRYRIHSLVQLCHVMCLPLHHLMQYEGKSALHMAAETGHTHVVQLLLNLQSDNNLRGQACDAGEVAAAPAPPCQGFVML